MAFNIAVQIPTPNPVSLLQICSHFHLEKKPKKYYIVKCIISDYLHWDLHPIRYDDLEAEICCSGDLDVIRDALSSAKCGGIADVCYCSRRPHLATAEEEREKPPRRRVPAPAPLRHAREEGAVVE
jgi:hypothetical protein